MRWALLEGLDDEVVDGVLAQARRRTFSRGEPLFHEGDRGSSLHLVAVGHFAIRVATVEGQVAMPWLFQPGDVFGRWSGADAVRAATVVSLDPGETYELYPEQLATLGLGIPRSRWPRPGCRGGSWARSVGATWRHCSSTRIVAYVAGCSSLRRCTATYAVCVVPLRQEDVAGLAGVSRATVSRVLGEEQDRGTVRRKRGGIEVLDREALALRAK